MWKYTKVCVNPRRGNTVFHMWIFTQVCVFPHAEMHAKLRIFQHSPFTKYKRCQHRIVEGSSSYTIDQRWLYIYIHYLKHIYPQVLLAPGYRPIQPNHLSRTCNFTHIIDSWKWYKHEVLSLTTHNWQKWKRVFLICPCLEIYRPEAVGQKNCKYTWKITIFVKMWNLGQYRDKLIFCL